MPKEIGYFFLVITFVLGISVGLYTSTFKMNEELALNVKKIQNQETNSVQDVVIKKVQQENEEKYDSGEIIEVSTKPEKVSPYAKLIVKKTFAKCNHTTVNIIDIPKECINLTEEEMSEKYEGWAIEKFSSNDIIISRTIEANCEDHYVLKENNGIITVYNELTEDKLNVVESFDVNVDALAEEEILKLKEGIRVYGSKNLSSVIEDYTS